MGLLKCFEATKKKTSNKYYLWIRNVMHAGLPKDCSVPALQDYALGLKFPWHACYQTKACLFQGETDSRLVDHRAEISGIRRSVLLQEGQ